MANPTRKPSLSIFFPCYNDGKSIGKLVENAIETASLLTHDFEVIVVDDGSKDNSPEILKKLALKYPHFKPVFHTHNQGYGGALRTGFKTATKDLIFYTDGDGQYDVKELPILFTLMTDDVNFVNGIKMARQDATYRILIGNLYSFVTRWMFWLPTYDVDCDFRLIRRSLLSKVNLRSNSGSICVELVKKAQKAGAKYRQVSVHHYERRFGHSQFFHPSRLLSTFKELTLLWIELILMRKVNKLTSTLLRKKQYNGTCRKSPAPKKSLDLRS